MSERDPRPLWHGRFAEGPAEELLAFTSSLDFDRRLAPRGKRESAQMGAQLADLGFLPAVTQLLDATPPDGQRMLFSATLDRDVDRLVTRYLTDPALHAVAPVRRAIERAGGQTGEQALKALRDGGRGAFIAWPQEAAASRRRSLS